MENKTARRLFSEAQASTKTTTFPSDTAAKEKHSRFSISDIIKTDESNSHEDSFSSVDSGTDTIPAGLEDSLHAEEEDSSTSRRQAVSRSEPHVNHNTSTQPGVYPSYRYPPLLPNMFGFAPPTFGNLHQQHPLFLPGMFPPAYHGYLPYPANVVPPVIPHLPQQRLTTDDAAEIVIKTEGSCSPTTDERTSPANSLASSGVSTEPDASPVTPEELKTRARAQGGRTCYSRGQVQSMEKVFSETRYPDYDVIERLSSDLSIPVKKIKVWFQNRRARSKAQSERSINIAAMMSAVPGYGFMTSHPITRLPFSATAAPMMIQYPSYPFVMNQ